MRITMTRDVLLAKLNERLAAAKKEDERIAAVHRNDEQKAMDGFKAALREAGKWSYETAKKNSFRVQLPYQKHPKCPMRQQNRIALAIRMVTMDTRKNPFSIAEDSDLYRAVFWEPEGKREPQTVCG